MRKFGVPVVVGINKFATDTDAELAAVREEAVKAGAFDAVICRHHSMGGKGAVDLGEAVMRACREAKPEFRFLYPLDMPLKARACFFNWKLGLGTPHHPPSCSMAFLTF